MVRRAQIMIKVLIGLLIGVMLLVAMISIARNILSTGNNANFKESFNDFAQTIIKMSAQSENIADTSLLQLKDKTIIIGIGPAGDKDYYTILGLKTTATQTDITNAYTAITTQPEEGSDTPSLTANELANYKKAYDVLRNPLSKKAYDDSYTKLLFQNGRFWDGDLHVIAHKDHPLTMHGVVSFYQSLHFERRSSMKDDSSYVCLCEQPTLKPLSDEYYAGLSYDATKKNMYTFRSKKDYKEMFLYELSKDKSFLITCLSEQCVEIPESKFVSLKLETYDNEKLYLQEEYQSIPFFAFENGFILDKNDFISRAVSPSYFPPQTLKNIDYTVVRRPQDNPVTIAKLSNGELAVCLTSSCVTKIEINIAKDTMSKEEGMQLVEEELAKQTAVTDNTNVQITTGTTILSEDLKISSENCLIVCSEESICASWKEEQEKIEREKEAYDATRTDEQKEQDSDIADVIAAVNTVSHSLLYRLCEEQCVDILVGENSLKTDMTCE